MLFAKYSISSYTFIEMNKNREKAMLLENEAERFDRQILLPEIGRSGQEKLKQARVMIAGAGGLGSPAALYLAAAGIGTLRIVDDDRVALSNLNRQILHGDADIGKLKVDSATHRLARLNSHTVIEARAETITGENAATLAGGCDAIIDALDNIETRFILNQAAVSHRIPFMHGAVNGFEGRAMTIIPGKSACLRCMHRGGAPSSAKFPVIGVAPGVIGAIQATETIKVLLAIGKPLLNRLLVYDGFNLSFREFKIKINPQCDHCGHLQ
jgi:molybdopterin/thiamine biosynthesis adenylyltransferase